MKTEDLEAYKSLMDECFGSSSPLEKYGKYRENAGYKIFVVKDGQKIIASATQYVIDLFTFDFQPSIMLFNVAVCREHRKQGVAKMLLGHILESAKTEGYRSATLTCLDSAQSAHRLYESIGFQKDDSFKYSMSLLP